MTEYIRQHTLPRFYIAGFYADQKPSKNPNVWHYPLSETRPREWTLRAAADISVRDDFYTLPHLPQGQRLAIEHLYGSIENLGAPQIRRLARGKNPDGLFALSWLVVSLFARVPEMIEEFGRHVGVQLGTPTTYPDRARNHPHPAILAASIFRETTEELVPRIMRMTWNVFLTTRMAPFISSDNPVELALPRRVCQLEDMDDPRFAISMPLSSTAAVLIIQPGSGPAVGVTDAPLEMVEDMNRSTISRNATGLLIASTANFPGSEAVPA